MKLCLLPFLILLSISCSRITETGPKEGKVLYSFTDVSGKYGLNRETRFIKKRLVTRSQMMDAKTRKVLEKSITVSQVGTIQEGKKRVLTVRPMASEFEVWLEGKKYSSVMQLNTKNKSMTVRVQRSDGGTSGTTEVPFPKAKFFCFYSQIPECLYHNNFLQQAHKDEDLGLEFYVVWDSYPFIQEQLTGIGKGLFSAATLKFEGEVKKTLQFMVELEGQVIFYHFSNTYDLVKIAWVAQGITVVPPGEEIPNEE